MHDLDGIRALVLVVSRAEFVEDQDADQVTGNLVSRFMDAQSASARLSPMTFAREAQGAFKAHFPVWIIHWTAVASEGVMKDDTKPFHFMV